MLYIVLPTHWNEVGIASLVHVGVILSINRFVRLPLNPVIGLIYKVMSFRTGILLAVIFSGITTISYGYIENFSIWILVRSLWGFSFSLFKLGAYILILDLSSETNRGYLMGSYNGLYRLGGLIGMLLGGIFADLFGVAVISSVLGFLAFLSIPLVVKYIPKSITIDDKADTKPSFLTNFKTIANKHFLKIFVTAFSLIMLLDGILTATLSHLIYVKYSNHINMFGMIAGAATVAGIIQALRWGIAPFVVPKVGILLDKVQHRNIVLATFLALASIFLVILPLNIPLFVWLPLLLIHLLVASSLTTIIDAIVTDRTSKATNKIFIMTAFTVIVDLGAALGPILAYTLEEKIGLTHLFWLAALICCLLMISWLFPDKNNTVLNQQMKM
ncbi:MFS transporter [Peribacillus saganii]|uniref:MFS transporter n=2 Tax=Peribacillus saganii TaxID=2303992 RepID=A0A372LMF2_9BACI|nr:MFS transporter [Peribacillus saganii]